jgi:hypothetical protein
VITYINPAVAITLGVLLLNEPFTLGMAIGFPLVIVGSILATAKVRRRRADKKDPGIVAEDASVITAGSAGGAAPSGTEEQLRDT